MENVPESQETNVNPTDEPPGIGIHLNLSQLEAFRGQLEQQKANKLKAEQIVSTLSRIKAREKASRRSSKQGDKKLEDGNSNQSTKRSGSSSDVLKEKSSLLKKKLEEDRAKFESKKGLEDMGKVSEVVEKIRVQLEDQDKASQQRQSNFPVSNKIAKHTEEVALIEPDIPPEVKQRIADLEMKIIDLQENLREKDSVISARTQAITLLSEDMARKGKNALDTLEETRSQMKTMQANFVALEDKMNEERARLREELDNKKSKVQQLEKNYRAAESARFDLSTRVAQLQEKVVALQTKNISLESEVAEASSKAKELEEALDNSNKQIIKMKAQFKAKLKAIEEERDMLKKSEQANEEWNRLSERIAELEDEKGNLQLHLVDFDEIQEAGNILKERVSEMELKIQMQESDLDSHVKAISSLESEKLDLMEATKRTSILLKEKDEVIDKLQKQISQIEDTKVSLEMKCLELEEKVDGFMKSESETALLSKELAEANQQLLKFQDTVRELSMKLENKESNDFNEFGNLKEMSSNVEEWQGRCSDLEEKLNSTVTYCQELEVKKVFLESENEKLFKDCVELKNSIDNLNCILISKSESSKQEVLLLQQAVQDKESEIVKLNKHSKTLETEVESLRYSLQTTTAELHKLFQQVEELNSIKQKLNEFDVTLDKKDRELEEITNELEARTRKLSEYKKFHKLKSEDVLRISHELETVTTASQQRISELEDSLSAAKKTEEELKNELKCLKEGTQAEPETVDAKLQEQTLKMKKLAANVKLKTKLVKDQEAKIEELENAINQKDITINLLENEKQQLQDQLFHNSTITSDICNNDKTVSELETNFRDLISHSNLQKEELELKTEELRLDMSSSNGEDETLVQIKELKNENKKLVDLLETKSGLLEKMETEINELSSLNKSLMFELEHMQQTYNQDSLKNESVLDVFEDEMLGSKKEILELNNQLKDITAKYEQTWAKLQEKEVYTEELEKAQSRLIQIESTVEERRRSFEEKTEMLCARLSEAEKNNVQLGEHEGELEQKISQMLHTEELLGNIVQKLEEENNEISKNLSESIDKNISLVQGLDMEHNKVQHLMKQVNDLQIDLLNREKALEDYEELKQQFRGYQEAHENQIKSLENHLLEIENNTEGEVHQLLNKIACVETERNEVTEKYNSLLIEKQILEEEFGNLQQTIADITKEEIEQLRKNHESLSAQLTQELERRQACIYRIQELENELSNQTADPKMVVEEIEKLKSQLEEERMKNEKLQYKLLKDKAKLQVDDVVAKAEETYFTMTSTESQSSEIDNLFSFCTQPSTAQSSNDTSQLFHLEDVEQLKLKCAKQVRELEMKLAALTAENTDLKDHIQQTIKGSNVSENSVMVFDADEWAPANKDEDDGWGWGSKDAILEQEHIQKQKINSELEAKVLELKKKLEILEHENSRLNEELKASQLKCNKLLKKIKEFKNKSDSLERLSRERSIGFDDLDLAMQEELKSQIAMLEKTLKECNTNLNALQMEKDSFIKRIDTLTTGNERLIEMKERQDIEVEMWQKRSNELQNRIQSLEWTIAELHAEQTESKPDKDMVVLSNEEKQHFLTSALEMEEKLNALAAENDYLQSVVVQLKEKEKATNSAQTAALETSTDKTSKLIDKELKNNGKYAHLEEENQRLLSMIQILEEKIVSGTEDSNGTALEYSKRIENLTKENERLSELLNTLKSEEQEVVPPVFSSLNENYVALKTENECLRATVCDLNEKLSNLNRQSLQPVEDSVKHHQDLNFLTDAKTNELSPTSVSNAESPTLFRGFTSCSDSFEFSVSEIPSPALGNNISTVMKANEELIIPSTSHSFELFGAVVLEPENADITMREEFSNSSKVVGSKSNFSNIDVADFKFLLSNKDLEIDTLNQNIKEIGRENSLLRKELQRQDKSRNSEVWGLLSDVTISKFDSESVSSTQNNLDKVHMLLEDKDLPSGEAQMHSSTTSNDFFGNETNQLSALSPSSLSKLEKKGLASPESPEGQINVLVDQISQLTKTLKDKENEIEMLTDKKRKYKEMYFSLAKEYDIQTPDQPNLDREQLTDQNELLNQLLEDKETQLEIMSQQIDQTIVAKENLQDELSLKLCEIAAAKSSLATKKLSKNILSVLQPENIEEVTTLCLEIEELTRLLQEKDMEMEGLRQQFDETSLEKSNLIDELQKEIEKYKIQLESNNGKEEEIREENERFGDATITNVEKMYRDELSLKEQEVMNLMNELHNKDGLCQDIYQKLCSIEGELKNCKLHTDSLTEELNSVKVVLPEVGSEGNLSVTERVLKLKENFVDLQNKLKEAKLENEEKDKTIQALAEKIRVLKDHSFEEKHVKSFFTDEKPVTEQHSAQVKSFTTEPFRVSTEQSSSDDDSSSKQFEVVQGQMMLMKEIQSLKQVLSMKDAEITRLSIALNEAQESLIKNSEEEVLRQRLDEALYTLHLRDVRCDELALELMQLLEERDSLQLRLSTAIRFNEELRERSKMLDAAAFKVENNSSLMPSEEDNSNNQELKLKLDQLHNVGYRRDVAMQQDQQKRHNEQMHLYTHQPQQDESQPASGFFNWLFGTSSSGSQDI